MPSRINLPKLSLFSSSRNSSSSFSSPPSPSSSTPAFKMPTPSTSKSNNNRSPVFPPARLHLRNILPSSPEEPPSLPPPPRSPRAWVWQCHRCMNVYRLSCTRRCLDCSHTYCVSNPKNTNPRSANPKKKNHHRRRATGLCGAEFDYVGWEQWGSWRRKVLGYEAAGRCEPKARDRAFMKKLHNCWIDCDSPSECCHRRFELTTEALRNAQMQAQEMVKTSGFVPVNRPVDPDLSEPVETHDGDETPPKSPLGQSSFLWDDDETEVEYGGENKENEEVFEVEEPEEDKWCADASGSKTYAEQSSPWKIPGLDSKYWASAFEDDAQACASKGLTVRNLTGEDSTPAGSDSESESDRSSWSTSSEESDDSLEIGAAV
ncbi:hypothetical protein F5B22DRAFT_289675 [Xylaria bambusicola]|uniref:uncharacterized protein n=1 Tax=Xylaria bambusicola TaxID=326684 RepID=UPI00200805E2|nr:uncharacterized protein F5B22DRAFT_289675 [Xylaria bambusicola]KAI0512919.1 hypothetical protein F5B22DRAFT_289675 [Xylaria bambusicola]